jgi:hypothetical protein
MAWDILGLVWFRVIKGDSLGTTLQQIKLLWTGYKQVENYKTRQVLLIHQLVLIC